MNVEFSYSVAIRTLGKAGEKYQQELNSIIRQTIPPKRIFVYIAEGYELPSETIGIEEYIYVKKGMLAQRAQSYEEIDTEYVLFLDDDVFLPDDAVEKMFKGLFEMDGDCIAADTFPMRDASWKTKIYSLIVNWVSPRPNDQWAFKIRRNMAFSYNNSPKRDVYLSQSAAGPASLWKIKKFKSMHLEDELWLEQWGFAYLEDYLLYNKLYANGGKLLVHYKSGIIHLDAKSDRQNYDKSGTKFLLRAKVRFILWWRTSYNRSDNDLLESCCSVVLFSARLIWELGLHLIYSVFKCTTSPIISFIQGTLSGYKYVLSDEYKQIPNYILRE